MRIAVSACLLGENCKYNGKSNLNERLAALLEGHEVIPVCPEMTAGLGCPRSPVEIKEGRVLTEDGKDVTSAFEKGALACFEKTKDCDLAILKSKSPSCGASSIYDGTFTHTLTGGAGVYASLLEKAGIPILEADAFCGRSY